MAIERFYKPIVKLKKTQVPNGRGGFIDTWVEDFTFQGLINQAGSSEIELANKLGISADHKLFCSVDTVIDHNDLVKKNGKYYRIVSEPKDTVERGHHYKILLKYTSLDEENFTG
jgi:SPP1 family predicted phage head-tail adaptor